MAFHPKVSGSAVFTDLTVSGTLTIDSLSGVLKASAGIVSGGATTTDLPEGTNLYYTSARFNTAFAAKSTTDLAEGTNLYFTTARARASISGTSPIAYDSSTGVISWVGDTDDVPEGANLYFTNVRARAALSATTPVTYNSTTGDIGFDVATTTLTKYVLKAGDTMTGNLLMQNGATTTSAYTISWNSIIGVTLGSDIAPQNYTIQAQDIYASAVTNTTGADLILKAGLGNAPSTTQRDGKVWVNGYQFRVDRNIDWGNIASSSDTSDYGVFFNFVGSNAGNTRRVGFAVEFSGTYTGNEFTQALGFNNSNDGTNTFYFNDTSVFGYRAGGDRGIFGGSISVTSGIKIGCLANAGGSNTANYGIWGATTITRTSGMNVGVFGASDNRSAGNLVGRVFGGAFVLGSRATVPITRSTSSALHANNADIAVDIVSFQDNFVDTWVLKDFGNLAHTQIANTTGAIAFNVWTTAANTGRTASTEVVNFDFNAAATQTWATGAITTQREIVFRAPTYAFAGASTITTAATVAITGAPVAGTNATITNPLSFWVQGGSARFDARLLGSSAAATAANDLTLGAANEFLVSGNTQINAITTAGWTAGSRVTLIFSGTPTVKHNTAGGGGTAVLFLAGSVDFVAAANSVLGLEYDGTQWQETFRKVA